MRAREQAESPPPLRGRVREGGEVRSRRTFLRDLARLGGSVAGLGLLAGCAPAPPPAAQGRVYRVGLLGLGQAGQEEGTTRPLFWARLRELGYVEGQNLVREERFAVGEDPTAQIDDLAAELVRLAADVIVLAPGSGPQRRAAMAATASIPIVLAGGVTEVADVESLTRSARNVTGIAVPGADLELKRLQLLVEAVPGISRVAVLDTGAPRREDAWEAAARSLGVDRLHLPVASRDGYESAFERAITQGADALLVRLGQPNDSNRDLIVSLAERHRLPASYGTRAWVTTGGLMMYNARDSEIQRRAADYADRILRGASPADLPIEYPTRYDLILNLRTARALGLTLSRDFMAQVDEVIE